MIGEYIRAFDHLLTGFPEQFPWFVGLLLGTGIFMTLRLGFIQLTQLKHAFQVIAGHYDDPDDEGDVTHFQALTVALSATVGVGNIAGVAIAIHYGGPGAIFWMWMTAFFGMALKFTECTLAIKYRVFDEEGEASGGPMYYIEKGLNQKWAAVFFAVCAVICSFATGNMNQSNTIASIFTSTRTVSPHVVGLVTAVLVGGVIIGGVKRIAGVTEKLAPSMALLYFSGAALILMLHLDRIPGVLSEIVNGAFHPESAFGGTAAGAFVFTLLHGVRRGLFSNEAGQGSAAIAHASARTHEPVREGVVAMTGPLIDTLIICSFTAMTILVTGAWKTHYDQVYTPGRVTVCESIEHGKFEPFTGELKVAEGLPLDASLGSNHAAIEGVQFLAKDGALFSGKIKVRDGAMLNPPEGAQIRGRGLLTGAPLTARAFKDGLEKLFPWGDKIVQLSVLLFALSTIISWSYYGDRSMVYLVGAKGVLPYRLVYLFFIYLGAVTALETVWLFGDVALSCMSIPNLIAILFLHRVVMKDSKEYFSREHIPYAEKAKAASKAGGGESHG